MITNDEIKNIAMLAKLDVKENELDKLTCEMQKIIEFADIVCNAPDFDDDFEQVQYNDSKLREDEPEESFSREEILSNAKDTLNGYFLLSNNA